MLEEALRQVYLAKLDGKRGEEKLLALTKVNLARMHPQSPQHLPAVVCNATEECGSEPKCFTDYLPRAENSLSSILVDGHNTWDLNISFFDVKGVETAEKEQRGYIDRKMVFLSKSSSALLAHVKISRTSPIWLCQLQKGFLRYPATMGELNEEAIVKLFVNIRSSHILAAETPRKLSLSLLSDPKSSSVPKGDHICFKTEPVPSGNHILSVEQKGSKQVSLSYLLYW